MTENIIQLLMSKDPANYELGFYIAIGQGGVELLNECIAAGSGNLNLSRTTISELPAGLVIPRSLFIAECQNLKSLPADLKIEGNIYR